MTHEFKKIINSAIEAQKLSLKTVIATVVALDGSSYRKPGVRMLLREDGHMTGAVSGGCVEKEVLRQAQEVFEYGKAKIMCYDGRYRLGCEGSLYILLETFSPSESFIKAFDESIQHRASFSISSYYMKAEGIVSQGGSVISFDGRSSYPFSKNTIDKISLQSFSEKLSPSYKLIIIGAEHDAVQLCTYASFTGWDVTVIASINDNKTKNYFPGAKELLHITPDELSSVIIDRQTAIVLMSHNYANDLQYLMRLKDSKAFYIGILGPSKRRNKLLDELITRDQQIDAEWIDRIHGPAGLNIGSVTPQEIAISIVSEILTVIRDEVPMHLKDKSSNIHSSTVN